MNLIQVQHSIEYLFDRIQTRPIHEDSLVKFSIKYARYFHGNKNHFQDFKENKITLHGLTSILKNDILESLRQCGPVPAPLPPIHRPEDLQDLIQDLSSLLF